MTDTTFPTVRSISAGTTMSSPLRHLIATDASTASLILRVALALVIFPHGAQKVLGWFGGYGFEGTLGYFTGTLGVPALLALLVFAAELLGPIGLLVGAFSRVAAAGLVAVMTGAVFIAHLPYGFFMNWSGAQGGEGYEYHLLVIGMSLALLVAGSGRWSFDRWLSSKL